MRSFNSPSENQNYFDHYAKIKTNFFPEKGHCVKYGAQPTNLAATAWTFLSHIYGNIFLKILGYKLRMYMERGLFLV